MSVWLTPDLKPFYGGTYYPGMRVCVAKTLCTSYGACLLLCVLLLPHTRRFSPSIPAHTRTSCLCTGLGKDGYGRAP